MCQSCLLTSLSVTALRLLSPSHMKLKLGSMTLFMAVFLISLLSNNRFYDHPLTVFLMLSIYRHSLLLSRHKQLRALPMALLLQTLMTNTMESFIISKMFKLGFTQMIQAWHQILTQIFLQAHTGCRIEPAH
ncbi:hypothetical protein Gohar_003716 [Gossypium harknessii]|uniref:Uncharacterized protein n=2 Tax=Gossypium TaxID=3633 RepID=A0A7J8WWQ5_GOSAI|nr:hypothetical protein [Gossypium aridum]MBA0820751.1 hypothetical protein [Gossypium harknessii]